MGYVNGKWTIHKEIDAEELKRNIEILMKQNDGLATQLRDIEDLKSELTNIQNTLAEINQKADKFSKKKPNLMLSVLITVIFCGGFYLYFIHQPSSKVKKGITKKAEIIKVIKTDLLS